IADELEADATLVQLAAIPGSDAVKHPRGVEGPHNLSRPVLAVEHPFQNHSETFVRIDEAAVFRNRSDPVGVAIGGQSRLATLAYHRLLQHGNMGRNWFRVDAGKQRVKLGANLKMLDAIFREDVLDHATRGAVHDVYGELETSALDHLQIN